MAIKSLGQDDDYDKVHKEPEKKPEPVWEQQNVPLSYNPFDQFREEEKDSSQTSKLSTSQTKPMDKSVKFEEPLSQSASKFVIKKEEMNDVTNRGVVWRFST